MDLNAKLQKYDSTLTDAKKNTSLANVSYYLSSIRSVLGGKKDWQLLHIFSSKKI